LLLADELIGRKTPYPTAAAAAAEAASEAAAKGAAAARALVGAARA